MCIRDRAMKAFELELSNRLAEAKIAGEDELQVELENAKKRLDSLQQLEGGAGKVIGRVLLALLLLLLLLAVFGTAAHAAGQMCIRDRRGMQPFQPQEPPRNVPTYAVNGAYGCA